MDIGILRLDTIPQIIVEVEKVVAMGLKWPSKLLLLMAEVVDVGQVWPVILLLVIAEEMLAEVDLGHKRPATIPLI